MSEHFRVLDMKHLNCPICLELMDNPYVIGCAGRHLLCLKCASRAFKMPLKTAENYFLQNDDIDDLTTRECPVCKEEVRMQLTRKAEDIAKLINNVISPCPNQRYGCTWFSAPDMSENIWNDHISECG